jgi:toxin FitB
MIILDTDVLSELMRPTPDALVVAWLDTQAAESIWLTSITVFEARMGLALLPKGKRRRRTLEESFEQLLSQELDHRVLPFDAEAAAQAALVGAARQQAGRAVDVRDTQIAGIAIARRATLATRNLRHFADLPTPVLSPWAD